MNDFGKALIRMANAMDAIGQEFVTKFGYPFEQAAYIASIRLEPLQLPDNPLDVDLAEYWKEMYGESEE